jgi:ATP-dependent Clp protease ATP-binding subunit ClpC
MEDGRLTDSKGRIVNFKNTIVIMTSNVGAHDI